jgi:hypothetical protein
LRRNGLSIWTAFRGNSKKQAEKAKQVGAAAIIYVRDDENPDRRLHITNVAEGGDEATATLAKIAARLPDPYRQASGDDDLAQQ